MGRKVIDDVHCLAGVDRDRFGTRVAHDRVHIVANRARQETDPEPLSDQPPYQPLTYKALTARHKGEGGVRFAHRPLLGSLGRKNSSAPRMT